MTRGSSQSGFRRFFKPDIVPYTDRIINLTSLFIGTLSLIFAIIVWRLPEPVPIYIFARDLTIFATFWLVNIFLIYRYATRVTSLDRARTYLTKYHQSAQNMLDNYKGEMFKYFFDVVQIEGPIEIDDQENDLFGKVCLVITTETRNALKDYFGSRGIEIGEDVAVTVKLLVKSTTLVRSPDFTEEEKRKLLTRELWVRTEYRDPYTHSNHKRTRRITDDQLYGIEANTAFDEIHRRNEPYFLENNLQAMGPHYHNENKNWSSQYNSTLVVPIQYSNTAGTHRACFGFLAADSLNKDEEELYDEGCVKILSHAADLLSSFFLSLYLYDFQSTSPTNTTTVVPSSTAGVVALPDNATTEPSAPSHLPNTPSV